MTSTLMHSDSTEDSSISDMLENNEISTTSLNILNLWSESMNNIEQGTDLINTPNIQLHDSATHTLNQVPPYSYSSLSSLSPRSHPLH